MYNFDEWLSIKEDTNQRFIQTLLANYPDLQAFGIYADWLEEKGDPSYEVFRGIFENKKIFSIRQEWEPPANPQTDLFGRPQPTRQPQDYATLHPQLGLFRGEKGASGLFTFSEVVRAIKMHDSDPGHGGIDYEGNSNWRITAFEGFGNNRTNAYSQLQVRYNKKPLPHALDDMINSLALQ